LRFLKTAGYSLLIAGFMVLASGRLLRGANGTAGHVVILAGTGLILISAATAMFLQNRTPGRYRKMILYCICAALITGVQLTGGYRSFLSPSYLLFLVWLSLPSSGGSATEFGLIIGIVEALAVLNSSIWGDDGSFITRLLPLLLPALRSLLVPFLFGLASEWFSERETNPADAYQDERNDQGGHESGIPESPGVFGRLIELYHRTGEADSTCLFLGDESGYLRLQEYASSDGTIISRFMIPHGHRLARIASNSSEPVLVRAESGEEKAELTPYRLPSGREGESVWILLCPIESQTEGPAGFLLQDFHGKRPGDDAVESIREISSAFRTMKACNDAEDESTWMARMVTACKDDSLEKSLAGIAGILCEMVPGSTVSIADVDREKDKTRIWVSLGPLSRMRRGKTFRSSGGVAGWIVKNGVPCRRSRLRRGGGNVGTFSSEGEQLTGIGSIMGVPVLRSGRVTALVMIEHADEDAFQQYHENLLNAASGLFSMREELAGLRKRFKDISGKDTLTGLPGITLFSRHLQHMAKEVQTYGWYVGVIISDIDGFHELNSRLGHSECDRLIRKAAALFSGCFSREIFVARVGPDSFAACLPRVDKAVMEAMCQRAADALSFQHTSRGGDGVVNVSVTASIGGVYTHINRRVLILAEEAEKALLQARSSAPGSCMVNRLDLTVPGKNGDQKEP
jgi:diguanylate cyclase (GGDEF)-like protein